MAEIKQWNDSTGEDFLPPGEVHVWAWKQQEPSAGADPDTSCLSSEELCRESRLRFAPYRLRFASAHANTRMILARYLNRSPADLVFATAEGGKPLLSCMDPHMFFNLSHSRSFGILAVSPDREVGVDIEEPREIPRALAERYLSALELQTLSELEEEQWLPGFLRCWTRKEAILKAEGVGLRIPLHAFDVSLKAGDAPSLLGARPPAVFRFSWLLYDVPPYPESFASLAVSSPHAAIRLFHYRSDETNTRSE